MIERKKRYCPGCERDQYLFSKGLCKACWAREYSKPLAKPSTPIAQVSKKKAKELKVYAKIRDEYMATHPICEAKLEGCQVSPVVPHHTKGRVGVNLYTGIIAVCNSCHAKIHDTNTGLAKELGFMNSRLTSQEEE